MTSRTPAVSGTFYPSLPARLRAEVRRYLGQSIQRRRALGLVAPHAGYMYAGQTAGAAFASVEIPGTVVILGPNHGGRATAKGGGSILVSKRYRTPLGDVGLDEDVAQRLVSGGGRLVADDEVAHSEEHAVEVLLPFLQVLNPGVRIVPILLGWTDWERTRLLARDIADALSATGRDDALVVASSDMNHYEPVEVTKDKDSLALEHLLQLDGEGLLATAKRRGISMCGRVAAACACEVTKLRGGTGADVVGYSHSGLASGDEASVVGYAAVRLGID